MRTTKGYADGPYGQIHYQMAGQGPAVLLCHQSPSSSDMFARIYPLLAAGGIQAVGMDTPGFGHSDPPPGTHSITGYAQALPALMAHLKIARATVLGHHTGASVAAEAAATWPDLFDRVILNGPPVLTSDERESYRQALNNAPRILPVANGSHLQALWDKRSHFTPGWTSIEAMHNGVIQMLISADSELDGFNAAFDHDLAATLANISQPCLILTNTGDDIYAAAQRARHQRPDFSYVELMGGTHDIVDEQPEAWAKAVIDFVFA